MSSINIIHSGIVIISILTKNPIEFIYSFIFFKSSSVKRCKSTFPSVSLGYLIFKPVIRKELQKLWDQLQLKSNIQEKWGDLE